MDRKRKKILLKIIFGIKKSIIFAFQINLKKMKL